MIQTSLNSSYEFVVKIKLAYIPTQKKMKKDWVQVLLKKINHVNNKIDRVHILLGQFMIIEPALNNVAKGLNAIQHSGSIIF